MPCHREGETERQREGGTERGREGETEGQRGGGACSLRLSAPPSLRLSVPLYLLPSLSLSLPLSVAGQTGSFEKQAISSAQEMPASDLDESLPNRAFANWFSEVIGPKAGVVWQLTECGEQIGAGARQPALSG